MYCRRIGVREIKAIIFSLIVLGAKQLKISPQIEATVISAAVSVLIGFITVYLNGKSQRKTDISKAKIDWIKEVRKQTGEIINNLEKYTELKGLVDGMKSTLDENVSNDTSKMNSTDNFDIYRKKNETNEVYIKRLEKGIEKSNKYIKELETKKSKNEKIIKIDEQEQELLSKRIGIVLEHSELIFLLSFNTKNEDVESISKSLFEKDGSVTIDRVASLTNSISARLSGEWKSIQG